MLSSTSTPSTQSPISTIPYDILIEILIHCLPQDRFEIRQPNTRIAPLLLCHICSFWRTIVLTTPIFWSHLSFCFTLRVIGGSWAFFQDDIDFIWWWKKHQGSNAPFLRLAIERDGDKSGFLAPDETTFAFVLDYMRTAQHLEVNPLFWVRVASVYDEIADRIAFPNLHTLVVYKYLTRFCPAHYFHHTFSALRRLAIVANNTALEDTVIPMQWATLTHLSITTFILSLDFWLHLTSAVPHLRWAYIYFKYQSPFDAANHKHPITRTLPHLATLFIGSGDAYAHNTLFSPLFAGLHLPALTTLFLSSVTRDWWAHTGITDIHAVLPSAPALRNLTLRKYDYLSPAETDYAKGANAALGHVAPLWNSAPHLAHLQLGLYITHDHHGSDSAAGAEEERGSFARGAFLSDNRWLDLAHPACPIRRITVIDHGASNPHHAKPTRVPGRAGRAANIDLHVISQPFTDFADAWKEWRSGI
jgi:hypothetical protein